VILLHFCNLISPHVWPSHALFSSSLRLIQMSVLTFTVNRYKSHYWVARFSVAQCLNHFLIESKGILQFPALVVAWRALLEAPRFSVLIQHLAMLNLDHPIPARCFLRVANPRYFEGLAYPKSDIYSVINFM